MRELHICQTCPNKQYRTYSTIEHNGHIGECLGCGTRVVLHQCSTNCGLGNAYRNIPEHIWLPLVKPLISAVCPQCGLAIKLGEQLKAHPGTSAEIKEFGSNLIMIGLIIGSAFMVADLLGSIRKVRRT